MYCIKCGLEIEGGTETVCPLCNMPLEERPAPEQGALPDESNEDLKLREMISDIERTITTSLGTDGKSTEPKQEELPFDLEGALSEEIPQTPERVAPPVPAETAGSDYEITKAVMEETLAGMHQTPLPIEPPPRRSAMKNSAAVLLIFGVVAAGIAAGYLFSPKEPPAVRVAAPVRRAVPAEAKKEAHVKQPPASQPVKQELPVPAENRPSALPVAPPAASTKEPAIAETAQTVKQEPAPEPVTAAAVQTPHEALAPPSPQPPAAERKTPAPRPKTAKAAVAGFYCVNVGSFKLKDSTDRVCRDLKKKDYLPVVETVTLNDGNTWYRVTVGNFATRDEAVVFGRELERKTKIKPMVVKRK